MSYKMKTLPGMFLAEEKEIIFKILLKIPDDNRTPVPDSRTPLPLRDNRTPINSLIIFMFDNKLQVQLT